MGSTPTRPDQWWVADFTYVWTLPGLSTPLRHRRVLAAHPRLAGHMRRRRRRWYSRPSNRLLFTRRRHDVRFTSNGLVFHSDAGSQYTAISFTEALIDPGIAGSVGTARGRAEQHANGIHHGTV